jgi:hypothetical protein
MSDTFTPDAATRNELVALVPELRAFAISLSRNPSTADDLLGSSFKCNTQSPLGIGCCDGHTKQAPQQRGTWRDISRA